MHAVVLADNFIGKCISFENVSEEGKGQAVALRSEGDKSVFFLCEFRSYQDTLYVNGGRQFFRECDVYGSVDFIFGDAAMILQKCNIYFRDFGYMTAQGRTDMARNTGISVDNCSIKAAPEFPPSAEKGFLGRPWKDFARVIVMKSFIDNVINPAGYEEWGGRSKTAQYIEYANSGPGSITDARVKWPGFHALKSGEGAKPFSVAVFIDGNQWLPSTGVPFDPNV